jgi:cytoskeleton protein RodZ
MAEIGATLREARMRARIDVSEIEAETKIRAKYLRALENEEWDLLPGPTFVRSFLRTYAQALGLDAKALIDEYRLNYERPSELEHQPVMSPPRRNSSRPRPARPRPSRGYTIAIGIFAVVVVLLLVGLLTGGKGGKAPSTPAGSTSAQSTNATHHKHHRPTHTTAAVRNGAGGVVALSLTPRAPIYVCLVDAAGAKRIPGLTLEPGGYVSHTYHSTRFDLLLGNNAVKLYVDGKALSVPASSKPIGYSITSAGRRTLSSSRQPSCG